MTLTKAQQAVLNRQRGAAEEVAIKGFLKDICYAKVWQTGRPGAPVGKHRTYGTMREPGLFDLFVTIPDHCLAFWWDSKYGSARLNKKQREFFNRCMCCGTPIGFGDLETLQQFLVDRGVIHMHGLIVQYQHVQRRPGTQGFRR